MVVVVVEAIGIGAVDDALVVVRRIRRERLDDQGDVARGRSSLRRCGELAERSRPAPDPARATARARRGGAPSRCASRACVPRSRGDARAARSARGPRSRCGRPRRSRARSDARHAGASPRAGRDTAGACARAPGPPSGVRRWRTRSPARATSTARSSARGSCGVFAGLPVRERHGGRAPTRRVRRCRGRRRFAAAGDHA